MVFRSSLAQRRRPLGRLLISAVLGLLLPVAASADATKPAAASTSTTPTGMVLIPAGEFIMGTNDESSHPNERPAHRVKVGSFYMDECDVTNKDFRKFVQATGYQTIAERKPSWEELKAQLPPGTEKPDDSLLVPGSLVFSPPSSEVPLNDMSGWWRWMPGASWQHPEGPGSDINGKDNYPVVHVSWDDAMAYAKWIGKRLPTEAEWEYAARGGAGTHRFFWGDELRPSGKFMANIFQGEFPMTDTAEDGFAGISPVKSFPPNKFGLYDMAGNVWQWCSDWYRFDMNSESPEYCENPKGPNQSLDPAEPYTPKRVVKGGSFLCHVSYCESYRPSARRGTPPDTGSSHTGFRCVLSADQASTGTVSGKQKG